MTKDAQNGQSAGLNSHQRLSPATIVGGGVLGQRNPANEGSTYPSAMLFHHSGTAAAPSLAVRGAPP
jgi:hypothetical protein